MTVDGPTSYVLPDDLTERMTDTVPTFHLTDGLSSAREKTENLGHPRRWGLCWADRAALPEGRSSASEASGLRGLR